MISLCFVLQVTDTNKSFEQHQDACLPITAINAVELDGSKFVLSGAGPDVLLTDESSGFLLSRLRVFKRNAVHGFHPLFSGTRNGALYAKLLVWGGQSFRIVKLSVQKSLLKDNIWLSSASAECRCPDWIMDVDSCECPRNDASQVARRRVSLITAHNTLLCAELEDEPSEAAPIRLHEISSKLKAMLYSADVSWISNSQILVAAGTVFGEIAVWSCRFDTGPGAISSSTPSICIHHFFTGHEGSIFGVNTSPEVLIPSESSPRRFLASCSDDRTIRIWDISSCSSPGSESKSLPMDQNVRGTGFGKYIGELDLNEDLCVAKAFGHEARIWGVNFLDASLSNGQLSFNLVSRGEDVTCQLWNFNFRPGLTQENEQTNAKLSHLWTYNHHTGKHIWSLAIRNNPGSFSIYSGGADGSVKSFNVGHGGRHGYLERKQIYTGEEVVASLPDAPSLPAPGNAHKGTKKRSGEKISKYAFVSDDSFIAMTTVGKVLLGRVSGQDGETFISWKYLTTLDGLTTYCQVAAYPQNGIAFMGDKGGEIWLYDHARSSFHKVAQLERKIAGMFALDITADTSSLCSFVVSFIGLSRVTLLQFQISESPSLLNSREFLLPTHFTVTSALLMQDELQMLLGSREGTVALFSTEGTQETPTEPLWCAHEVHGQDAVTSITGLAKTKPSSDPTEASPTEDYILTTGRDGNYCVHMLCSLKDGCQSHGLRTVHRSSPPLGANLETATFDEETNDLLITGFRGKCFVVWNETTQTEVMAVECAGAHRTWVCHPSTSGRVFLWTKAATFNAFFRATPSYRALRTGGHGREVKTMDISTPIVPANHTKLPILATGSEDTAIRLFLLDDSEKEEPYGNFECLRTLKKHNTGLQHIQWSKCGRFLFSSSGMESFHVWRIRHIPGFGIGAVPEGEYPKSQPQSDLRIMHFDAVGVEVEVEGDDVDAYLIFMCYSNSTVRVRFRYIPCFHYIFEQRLTISGAVILLPVRL